MNNWQQIKKQILSDAEVKQEYDELASEYQVISEVIRLRKAQRLTQKGLADRVGTTQSAIARLETGHANPTLEFLTRIAKALQTKLSISFG